MHFLQELVQDYLILAHPQADLPQIEHAEEITPVSYTHLTLPTN